MAKQRQLKNGFKFYLRTLRYSRVIYFVYHYRNYHKTEIKKNKKLAVHVLKAIQNLVISRCCFAEGGKEMYQEL